MGAEIISTNQTSQYAIGETSFVTLMSGASLTVEDTTDPGFLAAHDGSCTLTVLGEVVTYGSGVVMGQTPSTTFLAAVTVGETGIIQSLTNFGLDMRRSGARVDNDGVISGGNAGVSFAAGVDGARVDNAGTISSLLGAGIVVAGAAGGGTPSLFEIVNRGAIEGGSHGISVAHESLSLTNHGDIIGAAAGLMLKDDPSLANTLTLVNTGLVQGDTAAIDATGHDDSVTNTGTFIGAVLLRDGDNRLDNAGDIHGAVSAGAGGDVFTNAATGTAWAGVDLGGGANHVTNLGHLAAGLTLGDGDDSLRNEGTITGDVSLGDGANSAVVAGLVTGAVVGGAGVDTLTVLGRIDGGVALGAGADSLRIAGRIAGDVDLGAGDDHVVLATGAQPLGGRIDGGAGTDTLLARIDVVDAVNFEVIDIRGSAALEVRGDAIANTIHGNMGGNEIDGGGGNDMLYGRGGHDTLIGGAGDDVLRGGRGADTLIGGAGADILKGGRGGDVFVFETETDSRRSAPDVIVDFQRNRDMIDLSELVDGDFTFIGRSALSGSGAPEVNYKPRSGYADVRIDLDGDGRFDMRIHVADVTGLSAHHFEL